MAFKRISKAPWVMKMNDISSTYSADWIHVQTPSRLLLASTCNQWPATTGEKRLGDDGYWQSQLPKRLSRHNIFLVLLLSIFQDFQLDNAHSGHIEDTGYIIRVDVQHGSRNRSSHSATLPERLDQPLWQSGWVAGLATLAEWLSGWVAAADWLEQPLSHSATLSDWVAEWLESHWSVSNITQT